MRLLLIVFCLLNYYFHLQRNGKILNALENEDVGKYATINGLEMDGPTQEFSLGTPRLRTYYQEPSTPEMPDLSSVTQDICKVGINRAIKPNLVCGLLTLHIFNSFPLTFFFLYTESCFTASSVTLGLFCYKLSLNNVSVVYVLIKKHPKHLCNVNFDLSGIFCSFIL